MRGSPSLKPARVRRYLEALRAKQLVASATELTYREPLADFLREAASELNFGAITINAELSMPLAGKPDFQVANANGAPIGYGETKVPGSAADHEKVLSGEQVDRYRRNLGNLLVTDYLRFSLFREGGTRSDVTLLATPAALGSAAHLLEGPMPPGVRLEGSGSGRVDEVRYEREAVSVSINRDQRFIGVSPEAWLWGLGFRPLEHYLDDRKGRVLDMAQIEAFCRAVFAVSESLALAEPMNQALASVLDQPLELGGV